MALVVSTVIFPINGIFSAILGIDHLCSRDGIFFKCLVLFDFSSCSFNSSPVLIPVPGPARKVYRITADGEDACHKAILEALGTPHRCYAPIQLGLANLPRVSVGVALDALKQHRDGLVERLAHIQARRETQHPLPYFVEAMFDYSLTMVEAEKKWIENYIQQLEVTDVEN